MKTILIILSCLLSTQAVAIQFSSTPQQAILIELFTSQGCSSCPPADNWLTSLKDNPRLWSQYVPIAWHVDYWDYIGWKDRFAKKAYTERQRSYRLNGNIKSVYTPGLLKNGKEWRSWFWRKSLQPEEHRAGILSVNYDKGYADIRFTPDAKKNVKNYSFNIALLESNLLHTIKAGENKGKVLQHSFVVRAHKSLTTQETMVRLPFAFKKNKNQALAVWLADDENKTIIQATGAWLD